MIDVAARAGVSLKTVSRVVNQVPSVDAALRGRVEEAIVELGYQHNLLAAGLRSQGASRVVGFVTGDLADPFFATLGAAIDEFARERGFQVIMAAAKEDPARFQDVALELCRHRVRGLLVVPVGDDVSFLSSEIEHGLPVICVDRPGNGLRVDNVLVDNRAIARHLAEILVRRGHRHVALLSGSPEIYTHRERASGMREGLRAAGVYDEALDEDGLYAPVTASEVMDRLMARASPPTAVMCTNNRLGAGVSDWLQSHGGTVELCVFDAIDGRSASSPPSLSALQHPETLAAVAVERLFHRIDGAALPPEDLLVPVRLVDGETS